jgi:hypothetical protein
MIRGVGATRRVFIGNQELSPRKSQRVYNHSPDGFNWGYGGSGPSQLALAIMLRYLPRSEALAVYQDFKREVIAGLPIGHNFELPVEGVLGWIRKQRKERGWAF